jgi:hypothetical protein
MGFDGLGRVDFGDDYIGAEALGTHGDAASAPAVACDNQLQTGEQQVGGADDAVERGLPRPITIVKEVLGERVVHSDHRKLERAVFGHRAQTDDAGGGFFRATDHILDLVRTLGEELSDQVSAIVHGDLRLVVECGADVRVIGVVVFALDGKRGDAEFLDERGCRLILRRKRIRSANDQIGAAIAQSDGEVRCLRGDVQAGRHANALQRLLFNESLAN